MATPAVFVCSATGTIGTNLCNQLRAIGWEVHATTRNLDSSAAKHLNAIGVKLTAGDWDDVSALEKSITGCQMLFVNTFPDFNDATHELKQVKGIFRIARAAGVKHAIYSSGLDMRRYDDDAPDLTNFDMDPERFGAKARAAKVSIEKEIQSAGFPSWTILRPAVFMENFLLPKVHMYPGAVEYGLFILPFLAKTPVPLVDSQDTAKFAVAAFQSPEKFHEKIIQIASEIITTDELFELLRNATGRDIRAKYLSEEDIKQSTDIFVTSQVVVRNFAKLVDMESVRGWGIPLGTFADFLRREKNAVDETYRNVRQI